MSKIGNSEILEVDDREDGTRLIRLAGYAGLVAVESQEASDIINGILEEDQENRERRRKPPRKKFFALLSEGEYVPTDT